MERKRGRDGTHHQLAQDHDAQVPHSPSSSTHLPQYPSDPSQDVLNTARNDQAGQSERDESRPEGHVDLERKVRERQREEIRQPVDGRLFGFRGRVWRGEGRGGREEGGQGQEESKDAVDCEEVCRVEETNIRREIW